MESPSAVMPRAYQPETRKQGEPLTPHSQVQDRCKWDEPSPNGSFARERLASAGDPQGIRSLVKSNTASKCRLAREGRERHDMTLLSLELPSQTGLEWPIAPANQVTLA